MSGKGWVTTARGDGLNIDDLIAKSRRPIGTKEEKSTIKKRKVPGGRKPLNVRGFQPAQGEAKPQEASTPAVVTKAAPAPAAAFNDGKEASSQSDLTGIKVKKRASTKKPTGTAEDASNAVLSDITSSLEDGNPNAVAAAEQEEKKKPTRRRTK